MCINTTQVIIMKTIMIFTTIATLICTGCASRPPKTCYEMTITFNQRMDKQVICTIHPQTETPFMRKIQ